MKKQIELDTILQELYNISGLRISVHDTDFGEISAYPKKALPFCEFLQRNDKAMNICLKNDANALSIVRETEDVYIYHCQFGLYEAVAPIYHFGVLSGYLMMGQAIDNLEESRAAVMEKALPFVESGNEEAILLEKISAIPTSTKEKISSCISIMTICAEYITLMNYINLADKNLAHEVKKYINENFSAKITIETLCKHFFCSESTLMTTFKKAYNKTIMTYLIEVRLEHSLKLLRNPNISICAVAQKCGFTEQNYFSKAFSKMYNTTPTAYRKSH